MDNNKPTFNSRRRFLRQAATVAVTGAAALTGWEKIAGAAAINDDASFTIIKNGVPAAVIFAPDKPGKYTTAAIDDLNYWIKRISGVSLKIVSAATWDQKTPVIAVGESTFTQARGLTQKSLLQEISSDGAKVVIANNYAILAGPERDDYAVSEFVKYALNVRWIWPGQTGEVFEPRPTIAVTPRQWTWDTRMHDIRNLRSTYRSHTPPFARKELEDQLGKEFADEVWDSAYAAVAMETDVWLNRQRANVVRFRVGHSFQEWWDKYGEAHPDWFAKPPAEVPQKGGRGVKLNVSDAAVAGAILSEWQNRGAGALLNVTPNDARGYCTCAVCRSWDSPEMQSLTEAQIYNSDEAILSDRYLRFWNTIAQKAAAINPQIKVTTLAYRSTQHPPLMNIKTDPHLLIGYVGGEGYYPQKPIRQDWAGWAAAGAKLFWRPNLLHCGHSMPYLFPRNLGEDIHYFMQHNMYGYDFDSITGHWSTQGLNYYIAAEALLRPQTSVQEIEDEYYAAFGKAAAPVRKYFSYWQELTKKGPSTLQDRKLVNRETWGGWWEGFFKLAPVLYNDQAFEETKVLLQQAEELAANDQPVIAERVHLLRVGWEHSRMTSQAIDAVLKAAAKPEDAALKADAIQKREALLAYRKDQFKKNPLAINAVEIMRIERNQKIMW